MKLEQLKPVICWDLELVLLGTTEKIKDVCVFSEEFEKYKDYTVCGIRARGGSVSIAIKKYEY